MLGLARYPPSTCADSTEAWLLQIATSLQYWTWWSVTDCFIILRSNGYLLDLVQHRGKSEMFLYMISRLLCQKQPPNWWTHCIPCTKTYDSWVLITTSQGHTVIGDIASSGPSPDSSWHNLIVFVDFRSLQENQSIYDVPVTRILAFSYRLPSQTYSTASIHLWWTPDGHHEMCDYSGTRRIFRIQVCIRNRVHT